MLPGTIPGRGCKNRANQGLNMKFKKIFLTATLAAVAMGMSAQETVMVKESETVYRPN